MISDSLHSFRVGHVATVTLDVSSFLADIFSTAPSPPASAIILLRVSSVSVVVLHLSMADGKIEGRVGLCTNPLITIRYHVAQVSLTHRQHASFSGAIFLKEKNFPPENCSHGSKELIERSPKPCHLQKSEERIKRYMGFSKFNASTSFH